MATYRPRIFISSTIRDFKDLRSSLKFYLEEFGYKVLLSEFNDFEKPLNENTIHACIEAVNNSDIFILLLGSRAGGFYAEDEKITITRFEYRTAYELFLQNKIKIILFARDEIWKLKDDREELFNMLNRKSNLLLTRKKKKQIKNHPGPHIENAELIFDFLDEISRKEEIRYAQENKTELPKGNWVHSFINFEDIISVLDVELHIRQDISTIARTENLRRELARNISLLVHKSDGNLFHEFWYTSNINKYLPESMEKTIVLPKQQIIYLTMFSINMGVGHSLSSQFLDKCLESGDFLVYNKDINAFEPSNMHKFLIELKTQINSAKHISSNCSEYISEFVAMYKPLADVQEEVEVDCIRLAFLLGLSNAMENIFYLSQALYLALEGNPNYLNSISLKPNSPFKSQAEAIENERFSIEEIRDILASI